MPILSPLAYGLKSAKTERKALFKGTIHFSLASKIEKAVKHRKNKILRYDDFFGSLTDYFSE